MNHKKTYLFLGAAIIVVVAALSVVFISSEKASGPESKTANESSKGGDVAGIDSKQDADYKEALAKHLSEKGMVMYGAYWCPHCQNQKEAFGDAWQYIDYVECDPKGENANPDECVAQGITGYPTWIYHGEKYSGEQPLGKLAEISGFKWERN